MKFLVLISITTVFTVHLSVQTLPEKLKATIKYYAKDSLLNGSVLVAKGDDVLCKSSFGYENIERNEFNQDTTLFAIGSVTKKFISAAVLLLQQKGKLKSLIR